MRTRGFEVVRDEHREYLEAEVTLPHRATKQSAGYDIYALASGVISPGNTVYFATDIKAYMPPDEVLQIHPRSSVGIKRDLMLANTTAIIDADYYSNEKNDGSIGLYLRNVGKRPVAVSAGERIAQGVFTKYLVADNEPDDLPERTGGVGHSGS